ncbi:unnamed protein product [Acanthoscelides obtectus]|uniref:Uncharacterized protein n=1 Tax=Acanthoscelides obtectus TaxID=200917 RepID=A0A9P0LYB5_ACAOB|nr:unnamed protein product [Acanthoscelides obtectus]CAK1620303.1 hypothetical protein AOBTE_LOCUS291 [Acanthoscelides obtectus]
MFKVTLQGHSSHFKVTRKLKVTLQGHSEIQFHVSRSHFEVTFQGWHRRSAVKVVWHRRSALPSTSQGRSLLQGHTHSR